MRKDGESHSCADSPSFRIDNGASYLADIKNQDEIIIHDLTTAMEASRCASNT
ncbi:hypothetical protein BAQU_0869 [Bifidobacterium aquikefiri]|uniref:Uncharacterized protein n=1 Tax=Bifidobacterium aquikefiri TaxID=1653207 RepID=A0A261G5T5_9BIFI|nr:hypothetical protein BAQU_0869 [Bifidobacterium aquikefiri]